MRHAVPSTLFAALIAVASACSNPIGDACEIGGVLNDPVASQTTEACGDGMCLYYEDYGTFCTDSCASSSDCPHGYVCDVVDLDPTDMVDSRSLCIPEEPVGDDDDDTWEPTGEPPVISDLSLWSGDEDGACLIWHGYHWHDEDGDLNGAIGTIEFVDPDAPDVPIRYRANIEQLDAVDQDLRFQLSHDGSTLEYSKTYNVYVEIEDRAGNHSNQLAEGGYTTPSATCE